MTALQPLAGIVLILLLAWLGAGRNRRWSWRLVGAGLGMQFVLAWALLHVPPLERLLHLANLAVLAIDRATMAGTSLVFGYLGGGEAPFVTTRPGLDVILALRSLPIVIVFSALAAVLWHWRVIPLVIRGFARLLERAFGIGGAVGLGSAASIFVGMVEAPLIVRPHLARMTSSDLFVLMTCGMATVAGTVMGLYAAILAPALPDALSHILVASVISAPAAIMLAMLMRPGGAATAAAAGEVSSLRYDSTLHALTEGTADGMRLLLNIVAMLIVFVALVSLVNQVLAWLSGDYALTLQGLLGWCLRPLAWATGIPWQETAIAGELLATKVILNELVAYLQLAGEAGEGLSQHSRLVLTYALCGFANFGSLGIMLGGLIAMCPERRDDIVQLAPWSIWSGLLATCMTGAVVALVVPA